jgi:hypothetical protein
MIFNLFLSCMILQKPFWFPSIEQFHGGRTALPGHRGSVSLHFPGIEVRWLQPEARRSVAVLTEQHYAMQCYHAENMALF